MNNNKLLMTIYIRQTTAVAKIQNGQFIRCKAGVIL